MLKLLMLCYDANAILIRSRYAGTYAAAIAGRYGWEGLGGQGITVANCPETGGTVPKILDMSRSCPEFSLC